MIRDEVIARAPEVAIRLASPDMLIRDCDEGLLVYDTSSGKTSLVNHEGAPILRRLSADGIIGMDAARRLLPFADEKAFEESIHSLEKSGLIVCCPA